MDNSLKLTELKPEVLVRLLQRSGARHISLEKLSEDKNNGAPFNDDGTINLIEYAAWLAKGEDDATQP